MSTHPAPRPPEGRGQPVDDAQVREWESDYDRAVHAEAQAKLFVEALAAALERERLLQERIEELEAVRERNEDDEWISVNEEIVERLREDLRRSEEVGVGPITVSQSYGQDILAVLTEFSKALERIANMSYKESRLGFGGPGAEQRVARRALRGSR